MTTTTSVLKTVCNQAEMASTSAPTCAALNAATPSTGAGTDTCGSNAPNRLASKRSGSASWSSYRNHAVGRLRDHAATAAVLPQPAPAITTQTRTCAARSKSSSTDGRSTQTSTGPDGSSPADNPTLETPACLTPSTTIAVDLEAYPRQVGVAVGMHEVDSPSIVGAGVQGPSNQLRPMRSQHRYRSGRGKHRRWSSACMTV